MWDSLISYWNDLIMNLELSVIIELSSDETFNLVLDCMGLSAICMIGFLPGSNFGCSGLTCGWDRKCKCFSFYTCSTLP